MNPQDFEWENFHQIIMKTKLQEKSIITALQFGSQISSNASSYENSCSESSGGQGVGKIGANFGVERGKSQKLKRVDRWSKNFGRKSSFCIIDGHMSFEILS